MIREVTHEGGEMKEFAKRLRSHDWSSMMSDSSSVARRGRVALGELQVLATQSPNHKKLMDLASAHHTNFQSKSPWEKAWRWVGAYLWAHGVELTHKEAQDLLVNKQIPWAAIDLLLRLRK